MILEGGGNKTSFNKPIFFLKQLSFCCLQPSTLTMGILLAEGTERSLEAHRLLTLGCALWELSPLLVFSVG